MTTQKATREKILKEFYKKFNYASFTWNGEVFEGVKFAKQARKDIKDFLAEALDQAFQQGYDEGKREAERILAKTLKGLGEK